MDERKPDQPLIIQPVRPPLTHLDARQKQGRNWRASGAMVVTALLAVAALIWVFSYNAPTVTLVNPEGSDGARAVAKVNRAERAPFADLEYQRQLEAAKGRLAELVETQTALKESMQVGIWGEADYQKAMNRATDADLAFQEKRYEEAWIAYGDATEQFKALKARGEQLFSDHMKAGFDAVDRRDAAVAEAEFRAALVIKSEHPDAMAGLARAQKVPEVAEALRKAANHELAGRWPQALAAYDTALRIDPETKGITELRAKVGQATTDEQVRRNLSDGFAAMDTRQFERARTAFNRVLALDPNNPVAAGALAQVGSQNDVDRIKAGEDRGLAAEAAEDWNSALKVYREVLAIDSAIEFAKTGVTRAEAHQRAMSLLEKIRGAPEKLSSPQLFQEARSIVAEARQLTPGGPQLTQLIESVDALVKAYSEPVEVTLTSDGATTIILSTVGPLGTFSHKTVSLRPGEYTVVGSQSGCRDVRETIVVKPGMSPISVRCTERVN